MRIYFYCQSNRHFISCRKVKKTYVELRGEKTSKCKKNGIKLRLTRCCMAQRVNEQKKLLSLVIFTVLCFCCCIFINTQNLNINKAIKYFVCFNYSVFSNPIHSLFLIIYLFCLFYKRHFAQEMDVET